MLSMNSPILLTLYNYYVPWLIFGRLYYWWIWIYLAVLSISQRVFPWPVLPASHLVIRTRNVLLERIKTAIFQLWCMYKHKTLRYMTCICNTCMYMKVHLHAHNSVTMTLWYILVHAQCMYAPCLSGLSRVLRRAAHLSSPRDSETTCTVRGPQQYHSHV